MYLIGFTPLHSASWSHQVGVATLLLKKGADPNLQTPFYDSYEHDEPDYFTETALHLAAGKYDMDMMQLLISYKANVNATNEDGNRTLINSFVYKITRSKLILDQDIHPWYMLGRKCRNLPASL